MLGSPLVLDVLMHHHLYQCVYPHRNQVAEESLAYLKKEKMLYMDPETMRIRVTNKGRFFIEHILNTPFPTEKVTYVIERNDAK